MTEILILHGALGTKDQFFPLKNALGDKFKVHTLNFQGHGGNPIEGKFTIEAFAEDVLDYLDANTIESINIFGYSMGGYVALYLAQKYPLKVGKIFTLATKFLWTPEIAQHEIKKLDSGKIAEKVPAFANLLQQRHSPADWKEVLAETAEMMTMLGKTKALDYSTIHHDVLVGVGDCDEMVTIEETISVFRELPNSKLIVLPQTPHPIEKVSIQRLAGELTIFFKQ